MQTDQTAKPVAKKHRTESSCVVHWVFQRGGHGLTCAVDVSADHAYEVAVIPHRNISAAVIERFEGAVGALKRHAEVASALRLAGWILLSYGRHLGS